MRASLVTAALGRVSAVKWYNAPPMRFEDLRGKAILLEVFRTW